ncbi:cellulose synthase/poly-beta-1,6-N-acetylglucosamine synthase-like glycosyltransferase [Thermonema lapsum]|uniref:Cellulose synthase/poly-beta-1,6-N-acetylglucosamine synthase-like glycosyltransferase n=1 Tax=Thermonema lapsum TaxID=28195 RepID=A0A846MMN7_9BACT|nr:glycosyltransferase [Thermonema lapsum]NIK72754.1 cellulose synthase/poly-beta-1,6-N-acetylglucosamine synthase-like glycosyltransferase [Thermonema lapsum]
MMEAALWAILLPYCLLLLWILVQYRRNALYCQQINKRSKTSYPNGCLSVVVAMRNEADNIEAFLNCMAQQTLAAAYWELCLVDDHSDDNSKQIAERWAKQHPQLSIKLFSLPPHMHGKKAALTYGIQQSRYDFICCTDADCQPTPQWLELMRSFQKKSGAAFIGGLVRLSPAQALIERLQNLEMIALVGIGAALLHRGIPGMCNGANLAFDKKAFWQVGGYEGNAHIPTGDDEFLLQKIARLPGAHVAFLNHPGAVVYTPPQSTWKAWIAQRKRWISKWKYHRTGMHKLLGAWVGILYLTWLTAAGLLLAGHYASTHFALQGCVKFSFEFVFLYALSKPHRHAVNLFDVLLLFFLYPFYAAYFVWVGSRTTSYEWKNRRMKV